MLTVRALCGKARALQNVLLDIRGLLVVSPPPRAQFHSSLQSCARRVLPFVFERPPRIPFAIYRAGDNEGLKPPDRHSIQFKFRECEELKNADEVTKRLLSLEFIQKKHVAKEIKWHYMRKVQKHILDIGSVEVAVAALTIQIRNMQEHAKNNSRDKSNGVKLKLFVDRRNKFLRNLRTQDYQRFEWLLNQLNITYRPLPRYHYRVTRKGGIRELTQQYCENIRISRLSALRDAFKAQQEDFLKERDEKLKKIAEEEEALGLTPTTKPTDTSDMKNTHPPPVLATLKIIARTSDRTIAPEDIPTPDPCKSTEGTLEP